MGPPLRAKIAKGAQARSVVENGARLLVSQVGSDEDRESLLATADDINSLEFPACL